jgi:cytochrome c oxidase assembly protein subunit 11
MSSTALTSQRRNLVIAAACAAFFAGMIGMAYAAAPIYRIFCQVTGYGGTTQRVEQYSDRVLDRTIKVRFDANTAGGLPWRFVPLQREVTMRIGETTKVEYTATNWSSARSSGRATFNVTPQAAGAYFNKVECFCFTDNALEPGETQQMPVVFFIDPEIVDAPELKGVTTLTLSYTFFPIEDSEPAASAARSDSTAGTTTDKTLGG